MSIFKAYDIRGLYPSEINEKTAYDIARAFVDFMKCKEVLIGRDMRTSSPSIFNAVVKGVTDQGADAVSVGVVCTPMFYYAVNKLDAVAGLMITASHNPGEYNGFKLVKRFAEPLNYDTGIRIIEDKVVKRDFLDIDEQGLLKEKELLQDYLNYVKSFASKIEGLKVVIDCGNGMSAKTIKPLLESFNIQLISLYDELDGAFPNHDANPFDEKNLKDLQKEVIESEADIGFAFDGDADRVVIVNEKGEALRGDVTTALISKELLSKKRNAKIMYDLRSSKRMKELITEGGGVPLVSRVGHSFIKTRMRQEDVLFAGEMSGHYYFKDNFFTDSTAIPVVLILSLLTREKVKVSELVKDVIKYWHTGELSFKIEDNDAVFKRLEEKYKNGRKSTLDGLTIEFNNWWFNLRSSNTEPFVRLNLEADTKELMEEKKAEIQKIIY